jgi:hypothetical protein
MQVKRLALQNTLSADAEFTDSDERVLTPLEHIPNPEFADG